MPVVRQYECKHCGSIFWVKLEEASVAAPRKCKRCGAADAVPLHTHPDEIDAVGGWSAKETRGEVPHP
ncbi:MAG: hypothetical protein IT282_06955 [Bacteroidetes bacterium]|nr:hypothetical protein [Bacteroidota bacterium]